MTNTRKKGLSFVLAMLMLMACCAFAAPAHAEAQGPVDVYTMEGELIAHFDSVEEFEAHFSSPAMPLGNVCDSYGHVHGTKTYQKPVVHIVGGVEYIDYITCCVWCDSPV